MNYYIPQTVWHKHFLKPSKLQYHSFTEATWCDSSYPPSMRQCPKKSDRFLESIVCVVFPQQHQGPLLRNVTSDILLAQTLQLISDAIVLHSKKSDILNDTCLCIAFIFQYLPSATKASPMQLPDSVYCTSFN